MRKVHWVKRVTKEDGTTEEVVIYSGNQKSHMQAAMEHALANGEDVFIREDKRRPRRVRINPLTGKPINRAEVNRKYSGK